MSRESKRYFEPLAIKLGLGVTGLVVGTLVPALYFAAARHFQGSLELKKREVYAQGKLIRMALEHQMIENDRSLIKKMVENFSNDPSVRRVVILDHLGKTRFTTDATLEDRVFSQDSPTCQVCHSSAPSKRADSALIELEQGMTLRAVHPLYNREACHGCHDPAQTVNGVVIMDMDVSDLREELATDTRLMAIAIAVIAVVLLGGIGFVVRSLVLRRLRQIEIVTRAIADGDFSKRVQVRGNDALARLGNQFNSMTDSVMSLLSQLSQHRLQLENVMNSVDDGLLVVDETLTVVAANRALASRLGVSQQDLLHRRCCDIWGMNSDCSRQHATGDCPARDCFATGQVQKAFKTRHTEDGTRRQEEVFASPIFGEEGRVEQVVEVWRDITERISREAHLAEIQRLASVGTLATGFSHEVNTPLGTVLLCADDIARRVNGDCAPAEALEIGEQVDVIRTEILRCRNITQQFLQLSKGQSLEQDILEIPALVGATIPLIGHVAKEANVNLRVVESEDVPVVMANPGALQQVLLNLLLNAVHASKPGSEVCVSWHANSEIVIRVQDQGVGMSPEVQSKIFEPFFSQTESGTGLGLFVSHNLARHWGGDIRVESQLNKGSTFEITFPAQDA